MSVDQISFRQVLGCFATGVTVVTTGDSESFHGMTASAFTSLSLEPCLVLVCIDKSAESLPHLRQSGRFNVSILSSYQQELSRQFSRKGSPEAHGLAGVDFRLGKYGQPLLSGALAHLECSVRDQFEGGDHIIVVGEVLEVELGAEAEPLAYFRSSYRSLAAKEDF